MGAILQLIFLLLPVWALEFSTEKISVGGHPLTVEVADTPEKRTQGLMFRKSLAKNGGMLFIFDQDQALTFWMKNTLIPLSLGFFDGERRLVDVHDLVPATSILQREPPRYTCPRPARYVLEVNRGWFEKMGISLGARLKIFARPGPSKAIQERVPRPKSK